MDNETKNQVTGILDILSGQDSIKVDVRLDYVSISVLLAGIVAVGALLVFINAKLR